LSERERERERERTTHKVEERGRYWEGKMEIDSN